MISLQNVVSYSIKIVDVGQIIFKVFEYILELDVRDQFIQVTFFPHVSSTAYSWTILKGDGQKVGEVILKYDLVRDVIQYLWFQE